MFTIWALSLVILYILEKQMDIIKVTYAKGLLNILSGCHRDKNLEQNERQGIKITIHNDLRLEKLVEARKRAKPGSILSQRKTLLKVWVLRELLRKQELVQRDRTGFSFEA